MLLKVYIPLQTQEILKKIQILKYFWNIWNILNQPHTLKSNVRVMLTFLLLANNVRLWLWSYLFLMSFYFWQVFISPSVPYCFSLFVFVVQPYNFATFLSNRTQECQKKLMTFCNCKTLHILLLVCTKKFCNFAPKSIFK